MKDQRDIIELNNYRSPGEKLRAKVRRLTNEIGAIVLHGSAFEDIDTLPKNVMDYYHSTPDDSAKNWADPCNPDRTKYVEGRTAVRLLDEEELKQYKQENPASNDVIDINAQR